MASDQLLTKEIGEEFTCVGEWWLPKAPDLVNPESKRCGTLTFEEGEGIKLDIMGWLEEDKLSPDTVGHPVEMIWGKSTEGELITLLKCYRAGITMGTTWTESYQVHEVFVSNNAWFTPSEDITFKSLILQYTHLSEWVGISGFQAPGLTKLDDFVKNKKAEIIYKRPPQLRSINVNDYTISIAFGESLPGIGPAMQKATIEQHTSILVEPRNLKEITLDEVHILVTGIQNFLSLVMYDDPIYPLVIEGQVRIEGKNKQHKPHATMRLLFERLGTRKPSEKIKRHNILFTYKDVAGIWEGALNKLLATEDNVLKPVFTEFFAEYFSPPTYAEDRYMATIRAIEAFHRRTAEKDFYMPKENYSKTLLNKLNEQIDAARRLGDIGEDFQTSLKKRLSYGYQFSLRTRLSDLFEWYGAEFLTLFVKKKKSEFIHDVVVTRNWLTHFDEEDRDEALKGGKELAYLNLRLQLFMIALLLRYVGIPSEMIEDKFKHYKFDYLRIS